MFLAYERLMSDVYHRPYNDADVDPVTGFTVDSVSYSYSVSVDRHALWRAARVWA